MQTSTNEKLTFWKQKLQEYRESGLSRKAFSERNGLKWSTQDYWFTRLSKAQKAEGLVELTPVRLPAVVTPPLQVVVAGRYRIEVRRGFDPHLLAGVVHALEALYRWCWIGPPCGCSGSPAPPDMRKQINGLSMRVSEELAMDPFSGNRFLFCNKHKRILKVIYWDRNGFCQWMKRLEKDSFPWPMKASEASEISREQFSFLLAGIDFWNAHQKLEYRSVC